MKLKSTTYYWLAVVFGGVGMGTAMGAEGTAQTTGYISGTLFAVSLVLILAAVLLARLGFAAEDRERAAKRRKYGKINRTRASYEEVKLSEYDTGKSLWNGKKATMIRKVALVHALREAFPSTFGALYDECEVRVDAESTAREVSPE